MAIDNKDKKVLKSSIEREQNEVACSAECEKIKGSKNLNVPPLRFPEFTEEWKEEQLDNIATLSKGIGISKEQLSEDGEPCILYGELYTKYKSEIIKQVESKTDINGSKLKRSKANDVIIPCSGETAVDIATARCVPFDNILFGGDLNVISLHQYDGAFMSYQLNGKRKYDIARVAQGVSIVHLYGEHLKAIKTYNPTLPEQQKIAKLLSLLDDRIDTQNKIIDKLKSLIKGLPHKMAEIGLQKGCWEKVLLSTVLVERKELNSELYTVHSVSVSEGVINQIEYLGRSFAAKDTSNYHVARYGDIIYTKSPTGDFPYGIVKQSYIEQPVAISPLYGVYSPTSFETGVYLHYYFMSSVLAKNYLYPLIQKGAKNTINISNQRFLENRIALPLKQTDRHNIARALITIQKKLDIEKCAMDSLTKQRSYLLQQLFI
ncbi:restriction endonuclease subunit S [Bacteroides thetaiotaomicron]